jgi:transposase
VYQILEGSFDLLLVNAQHVKMVPGRKTDIKDCQWIAQLLEHGLLRSSFVPPAPLRELRELTRYRRQLIEEHTREVNRVHKLLEIANIKLGDVASDVFGASGRVMLKALIAGERDTAKLADLARGLLQKKETQLREALMAPRVTDHHIFMLKGLLDHVEFLE